MMSELTLEQQFALRSFKSQVAQMSREQAQELLLKLHEQMLVQETVYKGLLAHDWGISR